MSVPAEAITPIVTLDRLLPGVANVPAIAVGGISSDSRNLQRGDVFFACQGATSHGLDFVEQAVAAGVSAIVWDSSTGTKIESSVPMIGVEKLADRLGEISNTWFGSPSSTVKVAGVTGTNGKTTIAFLLSQCLQLLRHKCGYVGTLGSGVGEISADAYMTTPPVIELHSLIAEFRDQRADFAAIEVSSHALQQKRVAAMKFDAAIFTNLSRDHIDYHGSMENYGEAKARLFLDFDVPHRIINIDSDFGEELASRCGADVVVVSTTLDKKPQGRPYVFLSGVNSNATGSNLTVATSWGDTSINLPLAGKFNIANALQVLATLLSWNVSLNEASAVLQKVSAPPGRMQRISIASSSKLPAVYVDYSHTPASLEAALQALRSHCSGKLWCVFGCGGDRDKGKRLLMGEVAEHQSDCPVVTSDNPRSESPLAIMNDVLAGMNSETTAIADRAEAIEYAISSAHPEDTILIAGKGHEDYQVIGDQRVHFSDFETAETCLRRRRAENGGQA